MKYILRCFEIFSGLSINFKKSCLVSFGTNEEFLWRMTMICRFNIGNLPLNYVGISLRADPRRVVMWELIVEKFRKRLAGWKSRKLSFAVWVVLVNSILSSLSIYHKSLFQVPSSVIKNKDKIRRQFL